MKNVIFFDGSAASPNPGKACFAFTHFMDNEEIHWECGFIGTATNNVAEYTSLLRALIYCKLNNIGGIEIRGDSLLVVNQVTGQWKLKSESLKSLNSICKQLCAELNVVLKWIPREENSRADYLSKLPLKEIRPTKSSSILLLP